MPSAAWQWGQVAVKHWQLGCLLVSTDISDPLVRTDPCGTDRMLPVAGRPVRLRTVDKKITRGDVFRERIPTSASSSYMLSKGLLKSTVWPSMLDSLSKTAFSSSHLLFFVWVYG